MEFIRYSVGIVLLVSKKTLVRTVTDPKNQSTTLKNSEFQQHMGHTCAGVSGCGGVQEAVSVTV